MKFLYCLITPSLWSVLVLVLVLVWPPQYHSPGQTGTIINDRVPPCITCARITIVYFVFIYREIQSYTERKTIVYDPSIRNSHVVSVSDRISPSTIVFLRIQSRRYTIVIRAQVILQNTVVYDCERIVDANLRLYTEIVILDLGCFIFYLSLLVKSYIM